MSLRILSVSPSVARRWKVPMRMWLCWRRTSTAERVGEGSSLRSSASPVSISEKVFEVSTPSASSISVASISRIAALQRQPAVAEAAVGRLARALGAEIEQAARRVAQLREQEAAAVADVGIVHAELMAVIAQRQRLRRDCPGSGAKRAKWRDPVLVAQRRRGRPPPPSGRCGSAGSSAGNRRPRPDRRNPSPSVEDRGFGARYGRPGCGSVAIRR